MTQPPAMPAETMTREDEARIEVGATTVRPVVARAVVACFVAITGLSALTECALGRRTRDEGAAAAWSALASAPRGVSVRLAELAAVGDVGWWARTVAANRVVLSSLGAFERALEDESAIAGWLRPPAQLVATRWLGAGNERVYPGRGSWLFYRPDVELLTGRGFLDPDELERRAASPSEWSAPIQPDPRQAILRLHDDLEARGITLVVVPTPAKPAIHPEQLARRETSGPLHNPSYPALLADLAREGVLVFDTAALLAREQAGSDQYLATDTHWLPAAMELAAESLADFIRTNVHLPAVPDPGFRVAQAEVRAIGDTLRMLDLPEGQRLYGEETVWLRRVLQADGTPWRPSLEADVLVLGDSFSNIYSLPSMGWGESAGFVEQLSHALRRTVDRLVQNDEGAHATREMLRQAVGQAEGGSDRLTGKRVVVYQFAARELAFGDWRAIDLPRAP